MNSAYGLRSRLRAGAALVPASVAAVLACWTLGGLVGPGPTIPDPAPAATVGAPGYAATAGRVILRLPDGSATVTLDDTSAARALADMLPLRLTLRDSMGQAKSGRLPQRIDVSGVHRVIDPAVGVLYYWPPSGDIAVFYDDLGQSVPPPGLVRLGVLDDDGVALLGPAGKRFPVHVDPAGGW